MTNPLRTCRHARRHCLAQTTNRTNPTSQTCQTCQTLHPDPTGTIPRTVIRRRHRGRQSDATDRDRSGIRPGIPAWSPFARPPRRPAGPPTCSRTARPADGRPVLPPAPRSPGRPGANRRGPTLPKRRSRPRYGDRARRTPPRPPRQWGGRVRRRPSAYPKGQIFALVGILMRCHTERAAIYCRISSDRQNLRLNVATQEVDCREACESNGWEIVGVFIDNDLTAADPDKARPEYDRLMEMVARSNVDVVVVSVADRLHRQPMELELFVVAARSSGMTKLFSVKSGMTDLSDSNALMILRITGDVAANEVDRIRDRIRRKKAALAEEGRYSGGQRPFGYEKDGMTIRPNEAVLLRSAATRVLEGASLRSIRLAWNQNGVRTSTDKEWTTTGIRQVLIGPRIAGLRQHQGAWSWNRPAAWDPILDRETWEQVRAILTDPSRRQPAASREYPLRGVLKCNALRDDGSLCGVFLSSIPSKSRRHYGCKKDTGGCGHVWVSAAPIEGFVFDLIVRLADSPELLSAARADEEGQATTASDLVNANAADERMLRQLDDDYADRIVDRVTYQTQTHRLKARVAERAGKLSALRGRSALDRLGGEVGKSWDRMNVEDKRLIILAVVDSIDVGRATVSGANYFDPGRLTIRLRHDGIIEGTVPLSTHSPFAQSTPQGITIGGARVTTTLPSQHKSAS